MSNYKFKVGDKVRVSQGDDVAERMIAKVRTDNMYPYVLDRPNGNWHNAYDDGELELIEPASEPKRFKIGDRVRIKAHKAYASSGGSGCMNEGSVGRCGVITCTESSSKRAPYIVWERGDCDGDYLGYYASDELELVKQGPMFKVGDIVQYKYASKDCHIGDLEIVTIQNTDDLYTTVRQLGYKEFTFHVPMNDLVSGAEQPTSTTEGVDMGESTWSRAFCPAPSKEKIVKVEYPINKEKKPMATKYYRVKKDLPELNTGAILSNASGDYQPILDLWNTESGEKADYIVWDATVVEDAKDWFERVYEVGALGKVKYLAKDAAQSAYAALHKVGKDKE